MSKLASIDLNLLVALQALLAEQNVTKAGRRLCLSQPAMSASLARLRELLHDPLLVRTPHGMILTPRALELLEPLDALLLQIERTLEPPQPFVPATAQETFRIGSSDFAALLLMPLLMEHLSAVAPGLNILMPALAGEEARSTLEAGGIDLMLAITSGKPSGTHRQVLFKDGFACLVRSDHPQVGQSLSLEEYITLPHLLVAPLGGSVGVVDGLLAERGLSRRIAMRMPHFLLAPHVIARSDLILTLPSRIAQTFVQMLPLKLLSPPLPIPSFTFAQFWHERSHGDPAHRWLREQLALLAQKLPPPLLP